MESRRIGEILKVAGTAEAPQEKIKEETSQKKKSEREMAAWHT
jgi:hypothetical protein